MEISAMDRPGLLSTIANVIATLHINIMHAKISTLGEKVDDIFYLSTPEGKNITDQSLLDQLKKRMIEALQAKKAQQEPAQPTHFSKVTVAGHRLLRPTSGATI